MLDVTVYFYVIEVNSEQHTQVALALIAEDIIGLYFIGGNKNRVYEPANDRRSKLAE